MAAILVFTSREQWLALNKKVLVSITGWILGLLDLAIHIGYWCAKMCKDSFRVIYLYLIGTLCFGRICMNSLFWRYNVWEE